MAKKKKPEIVKEPKDEEVSCPVCGKPVSLEVATCPHCGAEFEAGEVEETSESALAEDEMAECPVCGKMVSLSVSSCPICGAEFEEEEEVVEERAPAQPVVAETAASMAAAAGMPSFQRPSMAEPVSEDEMAECPVCGKDVSLSVSTCPYCGAEFEEEEVEEIIEVEEQPEAVREAVEEEVEIHSTVRLDGPTSIADLRVIGASLIALGVIGSQISFFIDWYWKWVPPIENNLAMFIAIPAVIIAIGIIVFTIMRKSASEGKKVPRNIPGYMLSVFLFGVFALITIMLWDPINAVLQDSNMLLGAVFVALFVVGVLMIVMKMRASSRATA
ncbi:MAG TPA: zinc ribbon domain-containing protein [Thermoplasmata archaeon]